MTREIGVVSYFAAVGISNYIPVNGRMTDELERIWKDAR
jgi:hypothetical protein